MDPISTTGGRLNLRYSGAAIALELWSWLALMAVLLITAQRYGALAETIPLTFAPDGEPATWGPKATAALHPILAVFVYVIVTGLGLIVRRAVPPDRPFPRLRVVLNAVLLGKALFLSCEAWRTFCAMSCVPAPRWLAAALAAALALTAAVALAAIFSRRSAQRVGKKTQVS